MPSPSRSPGESRVRLLPTETPFPVHVTPDRPTAERAVACEIAELVRSKSRTVLGFATGSTMCGVYAELVRLVREEGLDLSGVVAFNLDEYLGIPAADPRSFRSFMRHALFDYVNVPEDAIHIPDPELARFDPAGYGLRYEETIRAAGGLDLQLLGLGRNAHIAFNEPGSAADSRTRVVELDDVTRRVAESNGTAGFAVGSAPTRAVTMGIATILEARRLRVLAFGEEKAQAVAATVFGPRTADVPASLLQGHADVEVWVDTAAAAGLAPGVGES
ncbi:MAG: glucosamine-6-phosphate deaminase [bacterium]|nr:glucosamine-6-phosphate deaminase [bacterium]